MKQTFYYSHGKTTKELTQKELEAEAALGNSTAKKEILKQDLEKAADLAAVKAALLKWLQ